jgi:exodeoxyribonuclease VII large subunit
MFAEELKKNVPAFPTVIGVVTYFQWGSLQDILNTLRRRYPLAQVFLSATLVQGEAHRTILCRHCTCCTTLY